MWNPILTAEIVSEDEWHEVEVGQVVNVVGFVFRGYELKAVYVTDDGRIRHIPAQMIRAENRVAVPA